MESESNCHGIFWSMLEKREKIKEKQNNEDKWTNIWKEYSEWIEQERRKQKKKLKAEITLANYDRKIKSEK